jgi:CBS domain containing-hemolysin-like protein
MPASKLLALFIQNKKSMALVVDEFGGTSGVVTMEDILEEIVGDIQDEHDKIQLEDEQISETEYRFSGRIEIDDINEKYHLNLPVSDDYETIAGLILSHHGSIPKVKDVVTVAHFSFKILKATHTKIELIHLKINK